MKVRVADYIADFLIEHDITEVFSVVGGGAMHLNDGLGHAKGLNCTYCHHEQACAIAAEGYARISGKPAAVCVTTGPGGTNAITGVVGAWLDSIPMIVISGQVRYDTTARSTGLPLRAMGDQEFDITKSISCMTKYSEMVINPDEIRYQLEKALYLALDGRKGPSWLDIPLNVQAALVEIETLKGFEPEDEGLKKNYDASDEQIDLIIEKIKTSRHPVINAGSAIRTAECFEEFIKLASTLKIPVVTGWNSIDLIETDNPLYIGRGGIMGDRAGNFAIQTCDLLVSLGSRLSIRQVGYNYKTWAKNACKIVVDIDDAELKKPTISPDFAIQADVKSVISKLNSKLEKEPLNCDFSDWVNLCNTWKKKYPVVTEKHYNSTEANVYAFIDSLSKALPDEKITVVGNGSACVVGSHAYVIKSGCRFIINSAIASMGYDLPAAVGACIASEKKDIVCISGDGSIQMNLQELQTIIHHKLPIKIYIINNNGYHSIRQTQQNFFNPPLVGIGPDSFDLSFPSMEKLAAAYGYPYYSIRKNSEIQSVIASVESESGPVICEIFVSPEQKFEPKAASKAQRDGQMISMPLENLAPFLPQEEIDAILKSAQ